VDGEKESKENATDLADVTLGIDRYVVVSPSSRLRGRSGGRCPRRNCGICSESGSSAMPRAGSSLSLSDRIYGAPF